MRQCAALYSSSWTLACKSWASDRQQMDSTLSTAATLLTSRSEFLLFTSTAAHSTELALQGSPLG